MVDEALPPPSVEQLNRLRGEAVEFAFAVEVGESDPGALRELLADLRPSALAPEDHRIYLFCVGTHQTLEEPERAVRTFSELLLLEQNARESEEGLAHTHARLARAKLLAGQLGAGLESFWQARRLLDGEPPTGVPFELVDERLRRHGAYDNTLALAQEAVRRGANDAAVARIEDALRGPGLGSAS